VEDVVVVVVVVATFFRTDEGHDAAIDEKELIPCTWKLREQDIPGWLFVRWNDAWRSHTDRLRARFGRPNLSFSWSSIVSSAAP